LVRWKAWIFMSFKLRQDGPSRKENAAERHVVLRYDAKDCHLPMVNS
jgi:hypothetical protein